MQSSNWQTSLSTPKQRIEHIFKNSLFCDVEFSVVDEAGTKVCVPANKFMLAATSPVFEAMFYGSLPESRATIDLPDCSKEALSEMLRYIYCEEVNLSTNNIVEVLYIAEKYIIPHLVDKCRKYIKTQLKPEQVFDLLLKTNQIRSDHRKEIEDRCWEIIDSETLEVVQSEAFLHIPTETLCEILTRDSLEGNELDLFIAVDKWASKRIEENVMENCGKSKRVVLGEDVIRLIRFPLMSHKEFAQFVLPTEVLTMKEVIEVEQLLSYVQTESSLFSCERRASPNKTIKSDP